MKAKNYTKTEILDATKIGLEFEFYSKLKDTEISRAIAKLLGKRVVIPLAISAVGEDPKPLYHSPIAVTDGIFKLEPDYSGGKGMFELVTGPVALKEGKSIINKVLDWIDQYGYTTERCSIHANLSFDFEKVETQTTIEALDVLKFVLSFDEKPVYSAFPTREHSVYARTIESIIPNKFFFYNSVPGDFSVVSNVTLPEEKYYGVNFTKREKGYLEFRYMGGKDYEKKPKKVIDTVDHFALSFFNVINNPEYTKTERSKLKKIFKKHHNIVDAFVDFEKFRTAFQKIEVTVDLNADPQVVKTFWEKLKIPLFDLMVNSGFEEGRLNFDSEFAAFQLAKAKLKNAKIKEMELIDCEIEGVVNSCSLYYCTISNSRLKDCQAMKDNVFKNSKLQEVSLYASNECEGCYIENGGVPINCKVTSGVIRKGEIGAMAEIADDVAMVEEASPAETMKATDAPKQTRKGSVKWIRSLNKTTKNNDKK